MNISGITKIAVNRPPIQIQLNWRLCRLLIASVAASDTARLKEWLKTHKFYMQHTTVMACKKNQHPFLGECFQDGGKEYLDCIDLARILIELFNRGENGKHS